MLTWKYSSKRANITFHCIWPYCILFFCFYLIFHKYRGQTK